MNLLICGDSFAADWTVKYPGEGWPNLMSKIHNVTNLAQAGCGEYKVLKQLESVNLLSASILLSSLFPPQEMRGRKRNR
jgi:hypothetical protein